MNTIIVPGRLGRVVAAIDQKIGGCTQQRHFFAMTLNFSNPSRSYDETGSGVRFWGYDGALEVAFFIEGGARSLSAACALSSESVQERAKTKRA